MNVFSWDGEIYKLEKKKIENIKILLPCLYRFFHHQDNLLTKCSPPTIRCIVLIVSTFRFSVTNKFKGST